MVFGKLDSHDLGKPNDFTKDMGELIRKARIEAGLSQEDLSEKIWTRQATISDWEKGKAEVGITDLIYLSKELGKPILYFFPEWSIEKLMLDNLSPELQNLLINAKKLSKDDLRKLIAQVKALAHLSHSERLE